MLIDDENSRVSVLEDGAVLAFADFPLHVQMMLFLQRSHQALAELVDIGGEASISVVS